MARLSYLETIGMWIIFDKIVRSIRAPKIDNKVNNQMANIVEAGNAEEQLYFIYKMNKGFYKKPYNKLDRDFNEQKRLIREMAIKHHGEILKIQNVSIGVINKKLEATLIDTTRYLELYRGILGVELRDLISYN